MLSSQTTNRKSVKIDQFQEVDSSSSTVPKSSKKVTEQQKKSPTRVEAQANNDVDVDVEEPVAGTSKSSSNENEKATLINAVDDDDDIVNDLITKLEKFCLVIIF